MSSTTIAVKTPAGSAAGTVDLDSELFGIEPNVAVLHQVVTAQLAARRAGTHSTKTRAEVRGGGAKPWKQKGTGRARAGSSRSPIWVGGGIAHGPKPRDYSQRTNKKMIKLALRSALSDRCAEGKVVVVDDWKFDEPSTKSAKAALAALGIEGKVLLVVTREDWTAAASFRNLPNVFVLASDQLNAYDILANDYLVFTTASLPSTASSSSEPESTASSPSEPESTASSPSEPESTEERA